MQKKVRHNLFEPINGQLVKANFEHVIFENNNKEYIVTLVDNQKYEILKGYGKSIVEAINDLHSNLI